MELENIYQLMTLNYSYAYHNLQKDLNEATKYFDQITNSGYQRLIANLKIKLSKISLPDDIEIHSVYNNFRLISNILDQELPSLSDFVKQIDNDSKINAELTPILITEKLLSRLQVDINMFIRSISLHSPDIIKPEEINLPDFLGKTLLMYATFDSKPPVIDKLIEKGANPFQLDKYNNSAFSLALKKEDEDLAKKFLQAKLEQIQWHDLKTKISEDTKGFFHFIATNLSSHTSNLAQQLNLHEEGRITCLEEAKMSYKYLSGENEDSS